MDSLQVFIDKIGLSPAGAQSLKEFLAHTDQGFDLSVPPDRGFYALTDEDLQRAGLNLRDRRLLMSHFHAQTGEGSGSVAAALQKVDATLQEIKLSQLQLVQAAAERLSATRSASKIKESELNEVKTALKCRIVWADNDPGLDDLLGGLEPNNEDPSWWDEELSEERQRERYLKKLEEHLPDRRDFVLLDYRKKVVKRRFDGVLYSVSAKNDALLTLRCSRNSPLEGALLGIELKKRLAWSSVRQAEAEYFLFASESWYPYCQVVTDLTRGGVAFYESGEEQGIRIITGRVFNSMDTFWDFYKTLLAAVPNDLGLQNHLFETELPSPKRQRFVLASSTVSQPGESEQTHAALRILANYFNNYKDCANVHDLAEFEELQGLPEMPSYIS